MNGTSIVGRIVTNLYANRLGPINLLATSTAICGALIFALFGAQSPAGAIAFTVVYGIASGACELSLMFRDVVL
jgi:hypothetical protein